MNIITRIRNSYITKGLALTLALNMMGEFILPTAALAITTGPSQPEVQSFEPVETTDMVNMFTGDFTYNIPLMYLPGPNGGYPINLAYHGGIGMEQEASWVGLGWNVNAGALVRNVRGFADDYDGDIVHTKTDMKNNITLGLNHTNSFELFGGDPSEGSSNSSQPFSGSFTKGIRYNNYKGFALSSSIGFPIGEDFDMGISLDSETGLGMNVQYSFDGLIKHDVENSIGLSYSNEGLGVSTGRSKDFYNSGHYEKLLGDGKTSSTVFYSNKKGSASAGSSGLGFSVNRHAPVISTDLFTESNRVKIKFGSGGGTFANQSFSGFYSEQGIPDYVKIFGRDQAVYGFENLQNASEFDLMDFSREKDGTITPMMSNIAAPSLNYDTYNVVGQGMSGSFRPFRTDVGKVHDPYMKNYITGGSIMYDAGAGHVGVGFTNTSGSSTQKPWEYKNDWKDFDFSNFVPENDVVNGTFYTFEQYEKSYYKMHGDKSSMNINELDFIGGFDPVPTESDPELYDKLDQLLVPNGIENNRENSIQGQDKRVARNRLIHKFKNSELLDLYDDHESMAVLSSQPHLGETSIFYYNWNEGEDWLPTDQIKPTNPDAFLDRVQRNSKNISKQNGAYKVLNEDGQYYVYGLPAYNIYEREVAFSVEGSSDYVQPATSSPFHSAPYVNFETITDGTSTDVDYTGEGSNVGYLDGTDKFISSTEKPPYAHSYMLTSILGADYVDVDNNGPSDEDLGYWVKLDYVKYADDYKWRMPFAGANYSPGQLTTTNDDKGSYSYGEKELWYVSRMETKTHVVVFDLGERNDIMESSSQFSQTDGEQEFANCGDKSGLLIEKISLYLKEDYYNNNQEQAVALQEVHFEYDYDLCKGVHNNKQEDPYSDAVEHNNGGKLTLRKIWFTYEGSTKGDMRPYEFTYFNEEGSDEGEIGYNQFEYDRWGNYKKLNGPQDAFNQKYLPYVNQLEDQDESDRNAAAWSLKKIELPSGGEINVEYEADDYAYVQSEQATQMMQITNVNDEDNYSVGNEVYNMLYNESTTGCADDYMNDPEKRRIYFKLEEPISATGNLATDYPARAKKIYDDYIKGLIIDEKGERNLFFKNYTQLRPGDENSYDYVSGYAALEDYSIENNGNGWALDWTTCNGGVGDPRWIFGFKEPGSGETEFTEGYITIKKHIRKIKYDDNGELMNIKYSDKYHPMAIAAWEHIRLNDPLMLTVPPGLANNSSSDENQAEQVASLLGFIPQTIQMFTGVWAYCRNNDFGRKIVVENGESVIRLCTPDKKKIGGGHRVKQIAISDNWDVFSGGAPSVNGVVYDYSKEETIEGLTSTISSGVAQYEPMLGGDEIALRYPKFYSDNVPFNTDQHSYFEHPLNQSYFPSPTIGYSKVSVRSINTKDQMEGGTNNGVGTTGVTEYEFYTAKDFPIIVNETPIVKSKLNLPIPIPFIGSFERKKIKAAQSYSIELNDMHGQIKSVKKYGLGVNNIKDEYATSSVEYYYNANMGYQLEVNSANSKTVGRLINTLPTLDGDYGNNPTIINRLIGIEYDFFTDQRQTKSNTIIAGGNVNLDFVTPVPIPPSTVPGPPSIVPSFWPSLSSIKRDMKTFVTNKVIFKSGILKEVHTYDGRAKVITKNEVYDSQSGRPILTSVNNEFENDIYNYSHPAHWEYDQMGAAYKNIGLIFDAKLVDAPSGTGILNHYIIESAEAVIDQLIAGDEFICKVNGVAFKAIYIDRKGQFEGIIQMDPRDGALNSIEAQALIDAETIIKMKISRSGRRNHVFTDAGTIVSLENPITSPRTEVPVFEVEDIASTQFVISFNKYSMDKVLNATAVVFKDEWHNIDETKLNENPYKTGEAGIWRPYKSYVYVGDRVAGPGGADLNVPTNISENGIMNNTFFFNWRIQNYEKFVPEWQWTTEISKYSEDAYELENIDRLGIRSSALYAYHGSLVVAVGANSGYHEIGAEDFERYAEGKLTPIGGITYEDDNLGFYSLDNSGGAYEDKFERSYRILGGKSLANGEFLIELETTEDFSSVNSLEVTLQTSEFSGVQNDSYIFSTSIVSDLTSSGNVILRVKAKHDFTNAGSLSLLGLNKYVSGRATSIVTVNTDAPANVFDVAFVKGKAHTGKMSMKFDGGIEGHYFPQGKIDLIKDKTYFFSAWVSQDGTRKIDYSDIQLDVLQWDEQLSDWGVSLMDIATFKKGKVIEGWQKIEFEFSSSVEGPIAIFLKSHDGSQSTNAYIDDIRISPKTGGVVTYVYNNENFRLEAILDDNNYATLYFYDEEGNLHLVKKETERGIQTVSENRGHTKSNQ